jgi:hypothetical protein
MRKSPTVGHVGARMANLIHGGQGRKLEESMGVLKPAVTLDRVAELSGRWGRPPGEFVLRAV